MQKTWRVPNMWDGGDAWILGGGPSLLENFSIPKKVEEEVRDRKQKLSAYSPYLAALHDKHVIGINVAYQLGTWLDMCFFGDKDIYLAHDAELSQWAKLRVTSDSYSASRASYLKYLPKEERKDRPIGKRNLGISTRADRVCWNWNSGAAAISIAAWTGAKRIILVGFDMNLSKANQQHFHNVYKQKDTEQIRSTFETHLQGFSFIRKDADAMNIEIINTSLNSAITDFPKVHIKELL